MHPMLRLALVAVLAAVVVAIVVSPFSALRYGTRWL